MVTPAQKNTSAWGWTLVIAVIILSICVLWATATIQSTSRNVEQQHDSVEIEKIIRNLDSKGSVALDPIGKTRARFTDGARTVVITGPEREFTDRVAPKLTVRTTAWVRLLPEPWQQDSATLPWFDEWMRASIDWTIPDVLEVAFQYTAGTTDFYDDDGLRYRGAAKFGPLRGDGFRSIGADFHDYLGLDWTFPDGTFHAHTPSQAGSVDCSGYIRLVYGYRMGMELTRASGNGDAIPRVADDIAKRGPGVLIASTTKEARDRIDDLRPGDLVFFDADGEDRIHHAGIYLGIDSEGDHRFISSRGTVNGPTISDINGASILNGDGHYAKGFEIARRF
ncbi:C40 family peptidase [Hoyosella rhizosphaerae]|uniref:NlpC/P60 domain-containing protein n=1 Tax=Hoyosella rhizosphaerae TaxID=1755582 RepID=A0A916U1V6_9ACTN|nr:NlpC/P60 family protein [Hoyosella rhizosphaerae]MBN4926816.1 C40 family peptidase [Hoyosella rhizosphaerae]GGC56252.1 hypothetical protein GCM10011410_05880 [Hoyosella rhizosphaerae]